MPLAGVGCKLRGCKPVEARVWSLGIVVDPPSFDDSAGFSETGEQMFVKEFVAQSAIEGLDEAVLRRLARRDVVPFDAMFLLPAEYGA